MSNRPQSIKSDIGILAIGQALSAVGLLIGIRILTHFISPAVFGAVGLLLGVVAFSTNLFAAPLLQSSLRLFPRAVAADLTSELRLELNILLTYGVLLTAAIGAAATVGYSLLYDASEPWVLPLFAILAVDVARGLELTLLNAARSQRIYSFWLAGEAWIRPLLAVLLVILIADSTWVVLTAYAAGSSMLYVLMRRLLRTPVRPTRARHHPAVTALRSDLIKSALPLVPLALITWVSSIGDRYLIGGLLGMEQAGIYAAAYGLISRGFQMITTVLLAGVRPIYFEAVARHDLLLESRTFRRWLLAAFATGVAGIVPVALAAGHINLLLLDSQFRSSASLMPWIAAGYAVLGVSQIYNAVSLGHNRPSFVVLSESAGALGSIVIATPLILKYGLDGAAWSVPLYFGLQLLISIVLANHCRRRWRRVVCGPHQSANL